MDFGATVAIGNNLVIILAHLDEKWTVKFRWNSVHRINLWLW